MWFFWIQIVRRVYCLYFPTINVSLPADIHSLLLRYMCLCKYYSYYCDQNYQFVHNRQSNPHTTNTHGSTVKCDDSRSNATNLKFQLSSRNNQRSRKTLRKIEIFFLPSEWNPNISRILFFLHQWTKKTIQFCYRIFNKKIASLLPPMVYSIRLLWEISINKAA